MNDLGTFGGDSASLAVSADGSAVVGRSSGRAFRWTEATGLQDLGTLGGLGATAFGVNDDGSIVVGTAATAPSTGGESYAFVWTMGAGMIDLGTFPGGGFSRAVSTSDDGQVVVGYGLGNVPGQGFYTRAFRWSLTAGISDLGTFGGYRAYALGVSADGQIVVGHAETGSPGEVHPFLWTQATGMQDLGTFGGNHGRATGVSGDGAAVAGFASNAAFEMRAFRWSTVTGLVDLGAPAGTHSEARAISRDGAVVVGTYTYDHAQWRAFRWSVATGFIDIGTLGGVNAGALGADGSGARVVGEANDSLGRSRAFLWELQPSGAFGIGERYCTAAVPNSTGWGATLSVFGDTVAAANNIVLVARSVPPQSFGYFLTSLSAGTTFPVAGSQGRLCLGGFVGRLLGQGQVVGSGLTGTLTVQVDVSALPNPFGAPIAAAPGQRWSFQAWFRDANPAATSNLSDAVTVEFE